jgi:hypothetical protein
VGVQAPAREIAVRFVEWSGGCLAIKTAPPIEIARTLDQPSHRRGMPPSGFSYTKGSLPIRPLTDVRRFYTSWRVVLVTLSL